MIFNKIVILILIFFGAFIYADESCLVLDHGKDSLDKEDRKNASLLFETILEEKGVVSCAEPFELYHLKLGKKLIVVVKRNGKIEKIQVETVEELSKAYERIVDCILNNKSITTENSSRKNQLSEETKAPGRIHSDPLFYARMGYGGIIYDGMQSGISIGTGFRFELDSFALDVSAINGVFQITNDIDDDRSKSYEIIRISGLHFFEPEAANSFYAGGGIAWGVVQLCDMWRDEHNWGVLLSAVVGYEMFRNSDIRLFFNLEATLPTFKVENDYAPSFSLSVGSAF